MTLGQISNTLIPNAIGCCNTDYATLAAYLNEGMQSLINASGETGWSFGWRRVAFDVEVDDPYIICPREIIRLVNADVRTQPINIRNEWYEFLDGGPGLQRVSDTCQCTDVCKCGQVGIYDRGFFPPIEIPVNQLIRVYLTNVADVGRTILFSQAKDENGVRIYSTQNGAPVDGFVLTLQNSFTTSAFEVTEFNAIYKDATFGEVVVKRVDADSGVEVTICRIQPDETTPAYRKYFIPHLPRPCDDETTVQINALAKLDFIPLARETDFLPISNLAALRFICESIRFSKMDSPQFQSEAIRKRKLAVRELQNEQRHVHGSQTPSFTNPIAGLEGLRYQSIGTLT